MKTMLLAVVLGLAACGGMDRACQSVRASPPDVVMDCACPLSYRENGQLETLQTITHAADCAAADFKCDALCPGTTG